MFDGIKSRVWSLDKLIAGLTKLIARLESLSAIRKAEAESINVEIERLVGRHAVKIDEAHRAERIRTRLEALVR